jgi:hypothetical protein
MGARRARLSGFGAAVRPSSSRTRCLACDLQLQWRRCSSRARCTERQPVYQTRQTARSSVRRRAGHAMYESDVAAAHFRRSRGGSGRGRPGLDAHRESTQFRDCRAGRRPQIRPTCHIGARRPPFGRAEGVQLTSDYSPYRALPGSTRRMGTSVPGGLGELLACASPLKSLASADRRTRRAQCVGERRSSPPTGAETPGSVPSAMRRIFISYATKDGGTEAHQLAAALEVAGCPC